MLEISCPSTRTEARVTRWSTSFMVMARTVTTVTGQKYVTIKTGWWFEPL